MRSNYGDEALATPSSLLVWFVPLFILFMGLVLTALLVRCWQDRPAKL